MAIDQRSKMPAHRYFSWHASALLLVLLIALTACSRSYDGSIRENFVNSCTSAGSTPTFCACSLLAVEKHFTQEEYREKERLMQQGFFPSDLKQVLASAREECLR